MAGADEPLRRRKFANKSLAAEDRWISNRLDA
jgi:hypothetical protein